ncbi:hypothetical protein FNJ87_15500 [Nonlabens mediterrranea]|uniref:Lipoprotein n=1 Tax=Nonlabens mediterrranea TaxID=1419947 RepID=A0ABS0A8F0_9FLAO|nr:hypothetical protein [Nonlabens mediterrranea]
MKKFFLIFLVIGLGSCNQQDTTATMEATDSIRSSAAYKEYVTAFNEYSACKEERPSITNAYMNKELTAQEFEKALEKNAKMCSLKKQIFNTRWQILQTEYDKLSEEYQIKAD